MPPLPPLHPRPGAATLARAGLLALAVRRFARGARGTPALVPAVVGELDVLVVVPARDEEERIGPCVSSLVGQGARVLVVDDGSSDRTRAVAEAAGATVIDAGPLPPGWAGKAHALQVGLDAAGAATVVFVDADTRAGEGFVGSVVGALGAATLVSAGARVDAASAGERWLHPAMLATLVYRFGPPGGRSARPNRTMANGQCTVVDRQALLDAGGFEPVRGSLLEDVALARHLAAAGHEVRFLDATDVLTVAGYGSLVGAWRGWGRSLDLRLVTPWPSQLLDLAVVWSGLALPLPRLLLRRGDAVDVAALAVRVGVLAGTRRAYLRRGLPYLLSPLADLAVAVRITAGTLRPSRRWRGRRY
ncbi:MAG TPA: glycosyltransferase family A protein [Acidimicrobiales bacterium]|nr:glycosyltransferase family A protein [Acidimicrobiales bacterium]